MAGVIHEKVVLAAVEKMVERGLEPRTPWGPSELSAAEAVGDIR